METDHIDMLLNALEKLLHSRCIKVTTCNDHYIGSTSSSKKE